MMHGKNRVLDIINQLPAEKAQAAIDLIASKLITDTSSVSFPSDIQLEDNGNAILHITVDENVSVDEKTDLCVTVHQIQVPVHPTPDCIISTPCFLKGETMVVLGKITKDRCLASAIIDVEYYQMFRSFSTTDAKVDAILTYRHLPQDAQQQIAQQMTHRPTIRKHKDSFSPMLSSRSDLRFKFNMCRDTYTEEQQAAITQLLDTHVNGEKTLQQLNYLLNIDQLNAPTISLTKAEIIRELDKTVFKNQKAKERFAEAVIATKYGKKAKCLCIMLVGPCGVGKTHFIREAARVLGRPCVILSLGSATSMVDFAGTAPNFSDSGGGAVVNGFRQYGTTAIVLGLDEFGAAANLEKEGGKVTKAFNDALSDQMFFKDAFLPCPIQTENTIFIATTNSLSTIPENLRNRFEIIELEEYTEEDKVTLAKSFILPALLDDYGFKSDDLLISDDDLKLIANHYCEDDGARDMKKRLRTIVHKMLVLRDEGTLTLPFPCDRTFIAASLDGCVNENNPSIFFRRHKSLYSEKNAREIRELLEICRQDDLDPAVREKHEKRLDFLLHAIPLGDAFTTFDEKAFFEQVNKTHYGLDTVKNRIAQTFFVSALMGKPLSSNHILLVGPQGCGKTTICQSIAIGCHAPFAKVSLNGVSDEAFLKGHLFSYVSANGGAIAKAIREMETNKGIIFLDEIDKMVAHQGGNAADALLDLLDGSAAFNDHFVGTLDLSQMLFIATANDLSTISPPLLDRFTVIRLDGYTRQEKETILKNYTLPKVIKSYVPADMTLTVSDEVIDLLATKYCHSMGTRDAERIVKDLVIKKIHDLRDDPSCRHTAITAADIEDTLGKPSAERGNFPPEIYAGLSRALAVTGDNAGMSFAVETMLIPQDNTLTVTGLAKETTLESAKLAVSYIKTHFNGVLDNKGIHLHLGEGSVPKDGPSAGVAILMSMLSAAFDTPITENVAYTGEINGHGYVFAIGGTLQKIQAADKAGCTKVFIPQSNFDELTPEQRTQFHVEVIPVKHVNQVINVIFPQLFAQSAA